MKIQSIIVETQKTLGDGEIRALLIKESIISNSETLSDLSINIGLKEGKNSIGIEEVKEIIEWNSKKSHRVKVAVITEGEKLTMQAQNSILKVLEEPAENTLIMIVSSHSSTLLDTIISRCKVTHIGGNDEDSSNLIEFLNTYFKSSYNKRVELIAEFVEGENVRSAIENLLLGIMQILTEKILRFEKEKLDQNVIEFLENCYYANKQNVNSKLILESININLADIKL